jgi:hypothetical protein
VKKIVVVHLHYPEVWKSISKYISIINPDEIHVTTTQVCSAQETIYKDFPKAIIYNLANQGRDIFPLLYLSRLKIFDGDAIVWKLHSKRSLHTLRGDHWRDDLVKAIAGTNERVSTIEKIIGSREASMVGSLNYLTQLSSYNFQDHQVLYSTWCKELDLKLFESVEYFAGTIFACHSQLLSKIGHIPDINTFFQTETLARQFSPWFAFKLYLLNRLKNQKLFSSAYLKMDSQTRPASKETYAFEAFFGMIALNYDGVLGLE